LHGVSANIVADPDDPGRNFGRMKRHDTLTDLFDHHKTADRSIRFIDGEDDERVVGYGELWERALRMLAMLQSAGMQPDDELIIFSRSNERFLVAYWAAILGGIIPVPVAVGISDEHRHKLFRIARKLRNPRLFTDAETLDRLTAFAAEQGIRRAKQLLDGNTFVDVGPETGPAGRIVGRTPDDIGFVQYSSGSTSEPKGIMLTHRNLTSTVRAMGERLGFTADDVALSWMPLTHDMGLIGYHLTMLNAGMDHAIMDTSVFVRRPLLWMSKTSELRATQIASPNFGYKHYLKAFERRQPTDLDLSCVKLLLNGAEPISVELCEEFLRALEPHGLARRAMLPVYGLAEATLGVTFSPRNRDYEHIVARRHSLKIGEPFAATTPDDDDAVSFVKLGYAIDGCEYRIVDDSDTPLADGAVGNIQIRGENVTPGVYGNPEKTAEIFSDGGWLRTGDCGAVVDGELVVTGRAKDIIIINGQNYYPHDIEEIVARIHELDLGKVVVCGAKRPHGPVEELLVFVLYRKDLESLVDLADRIRDVVGTRAGLEVDHVIPINRIPKTTSGKVQRASLAEAYLDGEFDDVLSELARLAEDSATDDKEESPLVRDLLAIAAEFSKERRIGPDDNLFEVGISSLTLTEIMLAIDEKLPGQVDVNDLFDYPTIRELAGFLHQQAEAP
jgi:acyl-CoA synthetase (AMP-forming)/AMP-acid ligase II/acyl carrier protein